MKTASKKPKVSKTALTMQFEIVDIVDQPDGSAIMTYKVDQQTFDLLCWHGLQLSASENKLVIITAAEAKRLKIKPKSTYAMTAADQCELANVAILAALKNGIRVAKAAKDYEDSLKKGTSLTRNKKRRST